MDVRFGLLFLFVLGASWACDARQLEATEVVISDAPAVLIIQEQDGEVAGNVAQNGNVCNLCEEFANGTIDFFLQPQTQTEIIDVFHKSCSSISSFKQQCIAMVDYYVPLFFTEISLMKPDDFCLKLNLCQKVALLSSQIREESCDLCHRAVSEVLIKLKDPDTQLEIIELLLKGCNSVQNYVQKCKKLVFEYGPLILANAEKFMETTDVCAILHACNGSKQVSVADS